MKKKFTGVLIVAAGKGIRSKSIIPKQYLHFGNQSVLGMNIANFLREPLIDFIQVVINKKHVAFYREAIGKIDSIKLLPFCFGGKTRSHSVKNGLEAIANKDCTKILIQDGARPFTSSKIIRKCIKGLDKFDVVFPGINIPDTLYLKKKESSRDTISKLGPSRDSLIRAQTPQAFRFDYIYKRHMSSSEHYTDDVNLAFLDNKKIEIIAGSEYNFKITTQEDIKIAEKLF
ncbi:MAG: IspD/TarI family cytidylyltransferase [Paracoccaceae bacterium]|tara:strand:+ start:5683 stop:6372 length:690 start_codon:yes stop_codon:yes gene_type:complete